MMSRIHSTLKAFRCDRRGIAAVEFAMIAPVLMLMMLGTVEIGRAVVTSRRFNLVTSVISDLVARESVMTNAELDAIALGAQIIWQPYNQATLKFVVMQVRSAGVGSLKKLAGATYVDWSYPYFGATKPADCAAYPLPLNMLAIGASTIIVNGSYTYTPIFAHGGFFSTAATFNWTSTSSHSPRNLCTDYNGPGTCLPTKCE